LPPQKDSAKEGRASSSSSSSSKSSNERGRGKTPPLLAEAKAAPANAGGDDDYMGDSNGNEPGPKGPVDRYGWTIPGEPEPSKQELALQRKESAKERTREQKWIRMLGPEVPKPGRPCPFWHFRREHRSVFERRVKKGIPDAVRSRAWLLILDPKAEKHPIRPSLNHYYKKGVPPCDQTIRADIPRTMPDVEMLACHSARQALYNLLRAYSNADPELGYYQGMAFPAALLLAYMWPTRAFWAFYHLMNGRGHMFRNYYVHDFVNLKLLNRVWDVALGTRYKTIHANLTKLEIAPVVYTSSWFLTAFLTIQFPPVLRLRIFDGVVAFGTRALLSLGLACVSLLKKELMGSETELVVPLLQNPNRGERLKDWRLVIKKWDKLFISRKDYATFFRKAAVEEFP
jgi:hypothetical protein